jgi:ribonuclease HI
MKLHIYSDGGARGNPGPAAIGFLILTPDHRLITERKKYLGTATNNTAEYHALIAAIEEAYRLGGKDIHCFMDSELVCRQLQGKYKVKQAHLKELALKVKQLETSFDKITYSHVPRENEKIQMADALVNEALDEAELKPR